MIHKKILFVVVLAFLLIPRFVWGKTTTDSFEGPFITNYSFVDTTGHHGNFQHFKRISDGKTAYCIEPGVSLGKDVYNGYYDFSYEEMLSFVSLSKEQLERISLYAYFGYGYKGHTGNDWIVATQSLIWKEAGRNFQFTSRYNPSDPYKYVISTPSEIKSHMEEIKRLVSDYLSTPSFSNSFVKIPYRQEYRLGNLNGFTVTNCENCTYSIYNNELVITPNSFKSGNVSLEKKLNFWEGSFIVYASSVGQDLLVPGNIPSLKTNVSFEVVSGKLKIKKYDQDNKSCKSGSPGSLKGSVYGLYKEDGTFVSDLVIDDACMATIEGLELGTYYVQEKKAGLHYELDPNQYYFELTMENSIKELTVYDKIYLGQVRLEKLDKDTKSCKSSSSSATLKGAIYGIYNEQDELIQKLVIGKDCTVLSKKNLLLGNYYLKEIKAPIGYKLDKKRYEFQVTKENAKEEISIQVMDEIYKTRLVINKNYLYFHDIKPESNAVFEIYNKGTMEKVATLHVKENGFTEIVLPYGEYMIRQVNGKTGYHFVQDISFVVDEMSDAKTYMTLLNRPYRGTLEFYKTDTQGKFLANVLIEVYNEQEELVYRGITDENGKIVVESLPYGKYFILEKKPVAGYQLFKDRLYFEIKEDKEIVQVSMENVRVPSTGQALDESLVYSVVLIILGIGILFYGKEKI